jgi:hypothetical protein
MGKWDSFKSSKYKVVDLGRPATFLIPECKLQNSIGNHTVEKSIEAFLLENFGAFTTTSIPSFGVWMNETQIHYDECKRYEVSFVGKEKVQILLDFLSEIAKATQEICLYVCAGQYSCLLYPTP